jgi:hypothetical protein
MYSKQFAVKNKLQKQKLPVSSIGTYGTRRLGKTGNAGLLQTTYSSQRLTFPHID